MPSEFAHVRKALTPVAKNRSRSDLEPMNTPKDWLALLLWILACAVAGAIGALASADASQFYGPLDKPSWAPPAGVFGPVWTLLYVSMAVSAWLVWRERQHPGRRAALAVFLLQLAVNALWSWLFFGWHMGGWAFADILVLLALIVATMVLFARIHRGAAWLLVPYLAWVSFASALNYSVWQRNPLLL
jgi:tryptophan-rich sensory protein